MRCGQCKEVFDASAHLLPAPPPALLPDVSLTDARPPPVAVVRKEVARAWGGGAPEVDASIARPSEPVAASPGSQARAPRVELAQPQRLDEPVLDIPAPTVPAFLAAGESGPKHDPLAPFVWHTRRSPVPAATSAVNAFSPVGEVPSEGASASSAPIAKELQGTRPQSLSAPSAGKLEIAKPAAYERPGADLYAPDVLKATAAARVPEADAWLAQRGYPPLEIPESASVPVPVAARGDAAVDAPSALPDAFPDLQPLAEPRPMPLMPDAAVLALVEDDSPAALLRAKPRKPFEVQGDADDEDAVADPADEVSFVVTARRKAFWRKPAIRLLLVLVLLLSVVGLAVQLAVQERDRIAAMDARTRPWLLRLCEAFQCEIAPPRQIADVVIDSSSFNKARGDSYQLTLAMKNRATTPVAMPAVELTLTDAQDQPVLRRVLLPADLAAPSELAGRGDWATSLSVIVTTGGARVAGYRLLAFYP